MPDEPTHLDEAGRVRMVDVSDKPSTRRTALAEGEIRMRSETLEAIRAGRVEKGEALAVARLAAIAAAKRTPDWIPLCHPVPLDGIDVTIEPVPELPGLRVRTRTSAEWRTGVEMEALTATAAALLTLYDMCKAMDRGMRIGPVRLLEKSGGASGEWRAEGEGSSADARGDDGSGAEAGERDPTAGGGRGEERNPA